MNDGNFYNGGGLNISGAAMGQMQAHKVEAFAHRDIMQAASNSSQVLGGVQAGVAKLMDYKTETEARQQLEKIQTETQARVKRGLEAAPGSTDSFFYADGSINQSMIDDLGKEVAGQLEGINPTFIDPERGHRFAAERDEFSGNLATRVKGQADLHQLQAIRRTSEGRMQSLMESRDWSGAMSEVDRQVEAGILTKSEADVKRRGIDRASASEEIAYLIDSDPVELSRRLDRGAYDGVLSYADQHKARRAIRARLKEMDDEEVQRRVAQGGVGFPSVTGAGQGGKKGEVPLREFMREKGSWTQQEINWQVRRSQGEDVTAEVQKAARNEAMAFDINSPMEPQRDRFFAKYGALGLDKTWLSSVWQEAEEARSQLTTVDINVNGLLDRATREGRNLLDNNAIAEMQAVMKRGASEIRSNTFLMAAIGAKGDEDDAALLALYEKYSLEQIAARTREDILAEYNAWRVTEGKEQSPIAQLNKLADIAYRLTGVNLTGRSGEEAEGWVQNATSRYDRNRETQRNATSAWEKRTEKNEAPLLRFESPKSVNLRFDSSQKDKPVGILVPQGWVTQEEVDAGSAAVEVTFDNKNFRAFRVVGFCDGDAPLMTHATAVQGGWNPQGSYKADAVIMRGARVKGIVDSQDAAAQERAGAVQTAQESETLGGLAPYRATFMEAGARFGVDPMLLMAIAAHETGRGRSSAFRHKNNAMGVSNADGPIAFGSVEESIFYMAERLAKNYDLTSLESIQRKYAPTAGRVTNDPRGLNRHWQTGVGGYYKKLTGKDYNARA